MKEKVRRWSSLALSHLGSLSKFGTRYPSKAHKKRLPGYLT